MRVRSYTEMLSEYRIKELDQDDLRDRLDLLDIYAHSVIVEAEHLELAGLCDWIKTNLNENPINWLHYGKTGYDFGFAEFFFEQKNNAERVAEVIPNIYTIYPLSLTPDKAIKSVGYDETIEYDPKNEHAIIFAPTKQQ